MAESVEIGGAERILAALCASKICRPIYDRAIYVGVGLKCLDTSQIFPLGQK